MTLQDILSVPTAPSPEEYARDVWDDDNRLSYSPDGTRLLDAENFPPEVEVREGCKVICDAKEGQMDLVTDENEEAWAKAVVETQGAELDAVTGATVSSDAVREAVAEILEKIR